MGAIGSTLLSGRVRVLTTHSGANMQALCPRPNEHAAIRTDLKAIFVSLELSRSTWVITSLAPGGSEKMSKHAVPSGDIAALLARLSQLKEKARARTGQVFPIIVIQEAGLDGFWIHRVLQTEGIESHVVDPASIATSRRRGGRRPIGSTAKPWCAPCWPTSGASPGFVRWSRARLQRDDLDDGACCLTKECSRADCSLPHANVPHAHAGAKAGACTGSGVGDPAMPNTSARAISLRQTFRRRWSVRSRWSG